MEKKICFSRYAFVCIISCTIITNANAAVMGTILTTKIKSDTVDTGEGNRIRNTSPLFLKRHIEPSFVLGETNFSKNSESLENWMNTDILQSDILSNLSNSTPLLVFGDGLAAGWRDGGLHREGQLFSFPNLIAHQMGIKNFNSPLFDVEHRNGTGFLLPLTGYDGPRWKEVTNNLAFVENSELPELSPYRGEEIENFAVPKLDRSGMTGTLSEKNGWVYDSDGRGYTDDMVFLWRLRPDEDKHRLTHFDLFNQALALRKPAIVFSVFGFDGWTDQNVKSRHVKISWDQASSELSPLTISMAKKANEAGAKGVVFTIPDFKHLLYFNFFAKDKLDKKVSIRMNRTNVIGSQLLTGDMIFLPTASCEYLFKEIRSGSSTEITLEDSDVADSDEISGGSTELINARIRREAEKNGFLLVDLALLYQQIHEGNYLTEDGYPVDGTEKGNFFSADGLYPSALGNAVIANETIKVLNRGLKLQIPFIEISHFATLISK